MFEYGPLPPLMFASMVIFMLYGFPVAFSLGAVGLFYGAIGILTGHFDWAFLQAMPHRIAGNNILSNDLLLAIPFFTFMGAILERCGLAEDMLEGMGKLFGRIPGGLAYAVILVGAILGAVTGTVAASVITMGVISLPIMLRYGYNARLATGVIAASGTITQVIPPSLVLVVLADQLGRPVGDMYLGAFGPSIAQVLIFMSFILVMSILRPASMPPLPLEVRGEASLRLVLRVLWGIVPSLVLIFLVLGTIFIGVATPTEGGAMGALGSLILAAIKRRIDRNPVRFNFTLVRQATEATAKLSAFVLFILIGARVFSLTFYGVNGHIWVEHLLTSLPGGQTGFLIVVNVMVFLLAFFLDFFELAFIVIPLLGPAAEKLGIDLIWFGVILGVNMQTSFMHPPFGFALFFLRSVAPKNAYVDRVTGQRMEPVTTGQIYYGAIPFVVIQCIMVALVILFPQMVTHYKNSGTTIDAGAVEKKLQDLQLPGLGAPGGGLPGLDAPGGGLPGLDLSQPPKIQ